MIKGIFFDLDGTLYLSTPILHSAYAEGIESYNEASGRGVRIPTEQEVLEQVGNPVEEIYANLFPELVPEERDKMTRRIVSNLLKKINSRGGRLVEGIPAVLDQLSSKYSLALVTNAQKAYMDAVVETYELGKYFSSMICAGEIETNDKARLIEISLKRLDLEAEEVVMVGDRISDRKAAEQAGTGFIGCSFGHGSDGSIGELKVDSLKEIEALLNDQFL